MVSLLIELVQMRRLATIRKGLVLRLSIQQGNQPLECKRPNLFLENGSRALLRTVVMDEFTSRKMGTWQRNQQVACPGVCRYPMRVFAVN